MLDGKSMRIKERKWMKWNPSKMKNLEKVEGWNGESEKKRDPTNWNTRVTMDENVGNFGWEINYVCENLVERRV